MPDFPVYGHIFDVRLTVNDKISITVNETIISYQMVYVFPHFLSCNNCSMKHNSFFFLHNSRHNDFNNILTHSLTIVLYGAYRSLSTSLIKKKLIIQYSQHSNFFASTLL